MIEQNNGNGSQHSGDGTAPINGGFGGTARDTRMIERALKQRWNVPASVTEKLPSSIAQLAFDIGNDGKPLGVSHRNRLAASRVLTTMVGQNQADEHKRQPDLLDVNIHAQVLENPDFYGNSARLAETAQASDTDLDGPASLQADDLRPAVGENGNGSAGHH